MKRRNKKLFALGMAAMMTVSLAACGASGNDGTKGSEAQADNSNNSEAGGEVVELEWLHIWPEYDAIWKEAIKDFESKHSNIKIKEIAISWDKLSNSLQTYFSGGDAPDVMATFGTGSYKSMGAIMDLTPYLEADDNAWLNSFSEAALGVGKVGDAYYSVPLRSTATVLMYNKTIMDENGWTEPKNQEEFETLMGEIKEAGYTPLICPGNPEGYQIAAVGNNLAEHELSKSGKLDTAEYLTGHESDISAEYSAAAKKLRTWFDNGWIDTNAPGMTREEAQQAFYTQKGVFFFSNNNEYATHEEAAKEAGFELGFMAMPSPEGVPTVINNFGSDMWQVYSGTENPEACVEWLKYLSSDEFMQKFADETASVVGNKNVKYSNPVVQEFSDIFSQVKSYKINTDYVTGDCNIDINMEFVNFLLDSSYTPEKFGEYAANAWATNIAENAG